MSIEANKELVRRYLGMFGQKNYKGALDCLADDVVWWVAGKKDKFPMAGNSTKAQVAETMGMLEATMPKGIEMRLLSMIAEGDRVAAEVESYGELTNGRVYNNQYHMLFEVKNGKLTMVKEYLDPMHTKAVFMDP